MARTSGVECDRCAKLVSKAQLGGFRRVIVKIKTENDWAAAEQYDLCSACSLDLGKWIGSYDKRDVAPAP